MRNLRALLAIAALALAATAAGAAPKPLVGVYYFDGWADRTDANFHVKSMPKDYPEREPFTGWYDDTAEAVHKQTIAAHDAGIDFFLFDWYDPATAGNSTDRTLNSAVTFFKADKAKRGMKYALLYVNDGGFNVPADRWEAMCRMWVKEYLSNRDYQRIDNRPMFVVYSPWTFEKGMGGVEGAAKALQRFRDIAKEAGLPGLFLMCCATPGPKNGWTDLNNTAKEGYDALTGYNYVGIAGTQQGANPYDRLVRGHQEIWDAFAADGRLPYVPVVTDGWDSRPWNETPFWYERTPDQFADFVALGLQWWRDHPAMHVTGSRPFLLVEAWNELGEGSYIVPTKGDNGAYLKALKRSLKR